MLGIEHCSSERKRIRGRNTANIEHSCAPNHTLVYIFSVFNTKHYQDDQFIIFPRHFADVKQCIFNDLNNFFFRKHFYEQKLVYRIYWISTHSATLASVFSKSTGKSVRIVSQFRQTTVLASISSRYSASKKCFPSPCHRGKRKKHFFPSSSSRRFSTRAKVPRRNVGRCTVSSRGFNVRGRLITRL